MARPAGRVQSVPSAVASSTRPERERRGQRRCRPTRASGTCRRRRTSPSAPQPSSASSAANSASEQRAGDRPRPGARRSAPGAPSARGRRARAARCDQAGDPGEDRASASGSRGTRTPSPPSGRSPPPGTSAPRPRPGRHRSWSSATIMSAIATTAATIARAVALGHRDAHVRAQAREAEVLVPEDEGLADHEEEPAAGHAHHAVPDEPDGAEGQLDPAEALPPAEPVQRRHLGQVAAGSTAASGRS